MAQISFLGAQSTVPATGLSSPFATAVDSAGDLYIADSAHNRVVEITPQGNQSMVNITFTLSAPGGVAVGKTNLYVSDSNNNRVIKVPLSGGTQTTVGSGLSDPEGMALDSNGNLYVVDSGHFRVVKITTDGTQMTFASGFGSPDDVTLDAAGNVYVADDDATAILKYNSVGSAQPNVGSGLVSPDGVAVDRAGNVYIVQENGAVFEVSSLGTQTTLPISGLSEPVFPSIDANYDLFIPDEGINQVIEFATKSVNLGFANVCHDGSPAPCSQTATLNFSLPGDSVIGFSAGTLGSDDGEFTTSGGTCGGTTSPCTVQVVFAPQAPGMQEGAMFIADGNLGQSFNFPIYGTGLAAEVGFSPAETSPPLSSDGFVDPVAVALGGGGVFDGPIYVTDDEACQIFEYNSRSEEFLPIAGDGTCDFSGDGGAARMAELNAPEDVAVDGAGNVYIADAQNNVIRKIDTDLNISTFAGNFGLGGGFFGDGGLATSARLNQPNGVALDSAGNLYIADSQNSRVRKVDLAGIITTVAGNGTAGYLGDGGPATNARLNVPGGVRVDSSGNLYIADTGNSVIRKVDTTGKITTVAGNFAMGHGYSGDNGPATSAQLAFPIYVSVDAAGELLISDDGNHVTRLVSPTGTISTYRTPAAFPGNLVVDLDGNLAMIDYDANAVFLVARILPNEAAFGSQIVNTASAAQDVTLTNIGNETFTISAITPPTGFNVGGPDTTCSPDSLLNLGVSCILGIEFVPATASSFDENLVLADNSLGPVGSQQQIEVTGTGLAPPQMATTTTLSVAPNPSTGGATVTLTAAVSPIPTGSPLGSVLFCDSGPAPAVRRFAKPRLSPDLSRLVSAGSCGADTTLGTVSLVAQGTATLTTTTLAGGDHSLYAIYEGNTGFASSTSATVAETVNAAYAVTAPQAPVDVPEDGSVQITITVPPLGGAYTNAVTLVATGLPPGATATFNPPAVTPGTTGAQSVMTIQLASAATQRPWPVAPRPSWPSRRSTLLLFAWLWAGLAMATLGLRLPRRSSRRVGAVLLFVGAIFMAELAVGCRGGFEGAITPPGDYMITVTGTSGSLHPSTTITLVVE